MRTWLIVGLWSLFAASGLFSQPQTHIDHLKPIPAYGEFGYGEAVFRALIKERLPELWMIVRPSFSPEYTVVLGRIWHNGGIRRELAGYQLRWAKAKEALWNWKTLSDGTMELDLRRHPELHEKSTDFPVEAGNEISRAWAHVLQQTRYPPADRWGDIGLDGVTYEFYVDYGLFGQTWSPRTGPPALMVDLGEALITYVQADAPDRPAILKEVLAIARQIQEYGFE